MLYGLFFLLGVLTDKLLTLLLQAQPLQKVWRFAEYAALRILSEAEVLKRQAITILEISYNDVGKQEELFLIKETINKKHEERQIILINVMRKLLPYETSYKTPQEAFKYLEQIVKQGELAYE